MQIIDAPLAEPLKNVTETPEGYLVADAFSVRTGIQVYRGKEVGRPELDVVNVYRPPEEVFSKDSVATFVHKPVTVGHPKDPVASTNWRDLAVGEVSTEAMRDGERLRLQLIVKDSEAISLIREGKARQLSAGYLADIEWVDGVAPDGQKYQAVQRNIRVNHLALVPRGRAGDCQIGDSDWGIAALEDGVINDERKEVPVTTKAVSLGDQAINVVEADAQKLSDHLARVDRDLGTKDAEIAELKKQVLSDEQIAERVNARVQLISDAKARVPDIDLADCKTDGDIVRKVVKAAMKDANLEGKSDDYVRGLFDHLTVANPQQRTAATDPLRAALADSEIKIQGNLIADEEAAWRKTFSDFNQ